MKRAPKAVLDFLAAAGKKGGRTRAKRLSPERRRAIARRAARARWAKGRRGTNRRKPPRGRTGVEAKGRTAEERRFLDALARLNRLEGEPPMTVEEENLSIEQARELGEL